jgi:hypothetical protein
LLSVIVPVHDGAATLPRCLDALLADAANRAEVIVVDDGSRDESARIAAERGARGIRLERNQGAGPARNAGARAARGDVLVFVDADVAVHPGTLRALERHLAEHPACAAVFGSYDAEPAAPGLVSRYRNLLHHFVHQRSGTRASHFWAGLGAIRRTAFDAVGGFDEGRFARATEDVELGYRLRAQGFEIHLDRSIQGTHLKRWTLGSMVRTDLFLRAVPWTELLLTRRDLPGDLSLGWGARVSVAAAWLAVVSLALAPLRPSLLGVTAAALGIFAAANADLLRFLARQGGPAFAAGAAGLHVVYAVASGLGLLVGLGLHTWRPRSSARRVEPGAP